MYTITTARLKRQMYLPATIVGSARHTGKIAGVTHLKCFFFKLKDNGVDEHVKFVPVKKADLVVMIFTLFGHEIPKITEQQPEIACVQPPPEISTPSDYLILIHKLKIPDLA